MSSTELLRALLATALASSAAMVLVMLLRRSVRQWLGASAAYLLWLAVPVTALAVMLPAPRVVVTAMDAVGMAPRIGAVLVEPLQSLPMWPLLAAGIWACGALLTAIGLTRQQRRFVRGLGRVERRADGFWQAQAVAGLPAVVQLWRPRIVLPSGFEQRYTPEEQQLVVLHEQVHVQRGDIVVNALLALMQCMHWFNPLLPFALRRCREDQELSCDERVVARMGGARRSYGNAMLKTGLALSPLPVGCHWQNQHPLKERIAMLKRPVPGKKQWLMMGLLSVAMSSGLGYAAWAAQPATLQAAPVGALHAITLEVDADGERQQFQIREHLGQPFAFTLQSGKGVTWNAEFMLEAADAGQLRLSGELKADGVVASRPILLIATEKSAQVKVSNAGGHSVLDVMLQVSPATSVQQHAAAGKGRISVEPEATPASIPSFATMSPPRYPPSMHTGEVWLKIDVAADGAVTGVVVDRSSGHADLDAAAVDAARGWTLNPGSKDGKAVAGQVRVPVRFDMDKTETETTDVTS
ncbi:MAG: TonB family protein [Stenotrophomonas sp.]|uniref:TonB family protein n=1 Tax=Stenotrophomonas sp. TaxID=69392 RepID=UPI003D6D3310